ncbi:MAG: PAS domain S-box protein, partial [Gemmatimonadota bacterium]
MRALRRDRALDVLVEDSPDVVVVHDGIEILYINRTGEARFGAGAAALVGRSIWEFVPESYRAPLQSRVAEMLATGRPAPTIEVPMSHLDGTGTWGEMVCSPLRFRGEPAIQTVIRDISERKRAEAALERTQERYRELFDAVPIGLYRSTADGRLLEANRALVDILRFPDRETLLGTRTPLLYADPEERAAWIAEAIRNGVVNGREIRLYTHDGEPRTLRLNCRVRRDAEGRARSFEGSLEDVTERNRMEQELRRSEQRLDLALSGSGFGLWDWDVPTGRIFADDRWFTMPGFAPHEFPLDMDTWIALVHPDDRGR